MTETKTIAKGSFWIMLSSICTKIISFIYSILIARYVLADDIGAFNLVLSILGILFIFTDLGLVYSLNRYVPYLYGRNEFGKLRNLVKLCYGGGGILTFIFTVGVFLLSDVIAQLFEQPTIAPLLKIMSMWLLMREIDNINRGILVGRKKIMESQILIAIQDLLKVIVTFALFYIIGFNVNALIVGLLISFLLTLPLVHTWLIMK